MLASMLESVLVDVKANPVTEGGIAIGAIAVVVAWAGVTASDRPREDGVTILLPNRLEAVPSVTLVMTLGDGTTAATRTFAVSNAADAGCVTPDVGYTIGVIDIGATFVAVVLITTDGVVSIAVIGGVIVDIASCGGALVVGLRIVGGAIFIAVPKRLEAEFTVFSSGFIVTLS